MRYDQLYNLIHAFKPRTIVEIGTWNGGNAANMLHASGRKDMLYVGYDLFEDATSESDSAELNVKPHNDIDKVKSYIEASVPNASITLVKGNTRETVPKGTIADFVFIDGGHSVETIASDYDAVKHSKVIVFDDYYEPDAEGRCPDLSKYGCNQLVKGLKHVVFGSADPVKGGGVTRLVMVLGV